MGISIHDAGIVIALCSPPYQGPSSPESKEYPPQRHHPPISDNGCHPVPAEGFPWP